MIPVIHIVTPCMNTRESIDRTILSVITQAGDFMIRYHVQDGGSTDGNYERVQWWQREVASGRFPIQCLGIDFTCAQEDDVGMYDAIIKGYGYTRPASDQFLTWINGDDVLLPGACAHAAAVEKQFQPNEVSWFGGSVSVVRHGDFRPIANYDRVIPTEAIRFGLCDGIHWDFVQQEGTFYRKWLWDSINPELTIKHMKVGGDWNAWRLMATRATLVQTTFPLGSFTLRDGQLSGKWRHVYLAEMSSCVSEENRRDSLNILASKMFAVRRKFSVDYPTGKLTIIDEAKSSPLDKWFKKNFGRELMKIQGLPVPVVRFTGQEKSSKTQYGGTIPKPTWLPDSRVIAIDGMWQRPAKTEQVSFSQVANLGSSSNSILYVAFPWATLIDKVKHGAKDAVVFRQILRNFIPTLPANTTRVTVCQHIAMREFMDIFAEAGIDHIFWPHATQDDVARAASGIGGPRIHPFPLYPVQVEQATEAAAPEADGAKRAHLFSFIGARADKHYPNQTRNHILDLLADDPRGFIRGRDGWFYHKVVYEKQVFSVHKAAPDAQLIEQDQAAQFRAVLEQSTFSLCPAGTGPNSIRLWESIGAGSIPVILADDWAPPGNRALWEAAAVFRPETPEAVSALPDELEAMARDPALLAAKRQAMRQLWLLYGPDSFVFDIHKLMQRLAVGQGAAVPEAAALPEPEPAPVSEPGALSPDQARQRLVRLAADLLLLPQVQAGLAREAETAQALLDPADPVRRHFDQVRALALPSASWATVPAGVPAATAPLPRPALRRGAVPRVHLFGHHSNRTPLSYEPIVREIPGRLTFVDRPEAADVLLTGFNRDFVEAADQLADLAGRSPRQKRLVLSEEPFWDTLWSGGFVDRDRQLKNGVGYRFLNHENSDIFDFTHFPYFPLSDDDLLATYAMRIGAVARKSPREMLESWKAARVPLAFFAEHRKGATYDKPVPERDIWTLCSLRTELAEICAARVPGTLCVGKGWREQKRRQELPSWHLDKLAQLTGRSAICSGIENTHQRHYVTEKVFDAFAVGAVPIYYASPSHRVFEFVPQGAMINIFGLDAGAAAERIAAFTPDLALAELWIETAQTLAKRFGDVRLIHEERRRFALHSLQAVLDLA